MQVVRDSEIYAALYFELREAMALELKTFFADYGRGIVPLMFLRRMKPG